MILKIKSITDVITNSSSEVFIMDTKTAERIMFDNHENIEFFHFNKITKEFLEKPGIDAEKILDACDLLDKITKEQYAKLTYYYLTNEEWTEIYEKFKEEIDKNLLDACFLTIEDHFANCLEVFEEAKFSALWSEHK